MSAGSVTMAVLSRSGRTFLAIALGIQVVGVLGAASINAAINDDIRTPLWEFPGVVWIRYPLLGVGAGAVTAMLAVFVSHGVTRRQFLTGAAGYAGIVCALMALVGALGFLLERGVYELTDAPIHLESQNVPRLFLIYVLLYGSYVISGSLIGAGFLRWKQRTAALMITPFVLPLTITESLFATWWGGLTNRNEVEPWLDLSVAAPIVVVVLAVSGWLAFVLLRDAPMKQKKA